MPSLKKGELSELRHVSYSNWVHGSIDSTIDNQNFRYKSRQIDWSRTNIWLNPKMIFN